MHFHIQLLTVKKLKNNSIHKSVIKNVKKYILFLIKHSFSFLRGNLNLEIKVLGLDGYERNAPNNVILKICFFSNYLSAFNKIYLSEEKKTFDTKLFFNDILST